jgi:hypothetical protein
MPRVKERILTHVAVDEISDERAPGDDTARCHGDGIWVYLKAGYCNGEEHTCVTGLCVHVVHEWTWTNAAKALRRIRKCTCNDCNPQTPTPPREG